MSISPPASSAVEYDDIQGLVRFGHGHLGGSAFLLLRVRDAAAARRWLTTAPVTSAATAASPPESALQLALTAAGLAALGLADHLLQQFAREFLDGMSGDANRSRRLGDTGANDPRHWLWGGEDSAIPHLLVMLYAPPEQLEDRVMALQDSAFNGAFEVQQQLLAHSPGPREAFGFVDGISQPQPDWGQTLAIEPAARQGFDNRLALGEILLGYRNEYGLFSERPLLPADSLDDPDLLPAAADQADAVDLGRNGTYLVMRQLEQDVPAFWQYLDQQAGSDSDAREQLAALLVGRWRDGRPLLPRESHAIGGIDPQDSDNHFLYQRDPFGQRCPLGAHVRRANPRSGDYPADASSGLSRLLRSLGFMRQHPGDDLVASARFHRLLRRGRVYGTELSPEQALQATAEQRQEERGLHFVCLGANISRQFEFVQNAWMASSKFAGLASETDPLLGNREPLPDGQPGDQFSIPQEGAPARCLQGLPQFVQVRGGAYFFLPGIRALRFLAGAETDQ